MTSSIKDFAALKSLRKQLKAEEEKRQTLEAEQRRKAQAAKQEAELFRRAIGNVNPLRSDNRVVLDSPRPLPLARQREADEQAALRESLSDDFDPDTLLDTDAALSFVRTGLSQDVLRKLRRGQWIIQNQLDLHGMRRDEAREAVSNFLREAVKRGQRCVRIIHGKGLGSRNKEPVLKGKVRTWLMQKEEVIAFCQARAADGGSGALVVLLKA